MTLKRLYGGICVWRCNITEQAVSDRHALRLLAEVRCLPVGKECSCNDDCTSVRRNVCLVLSYVGRTAHRNLWWRCSMSVGSAEEDMHVERRCAGVGVCGRERRAPQERRALAPGEDGDILGGWRMLGFRCLNRVYAPPLLRGRVRAATASRPSWPAEGWRCSISRRCCVDMSGFCEASRCCRLTQHST